MWILRNKQLGKLEPEVGRKGEKECQPEYGSLKIIVIFFIVLKVFKFKLFWSYSSLPKLLHIPFPFLHMQLEALSQKRNKTPIKQ